MQFLKEFFFPTLNLSDCTLWVLKATGGFLWGAQVRVVHLHASCSGAPGHNTNVFSPGLATEHYHHHQWVFSFFPFSSDIQKLIMNTVLKCKHDANVFTPLQCYMKWIITLFFLATELQAKGINAVQKGQSIVVATSTASGKSLCYNVPVLEMLNQDSSSCALYLFPTKVTSAKCFCDFLVSWIFWHSGLNTNVLQ